MLCSCFCLLFRRAGGRLGACLPPPFVYHLPHARLLALVPLSADPPIETTTTTADACVHCPFLPLMFLFCLFPLFFVFLLTSQQQQEDAYCCHTKLGLGLTDMQLLCSTDVSRFDFYFFREREKREEIGSMQKRSDSDSVLLFKGMSSVGFIFAVSVPIHR